jgi:Tannase and feruloyl esterase
MLAGLALTMSLLALPASARHPDRDQPKPRLECDVTVLQMLMPPNTTLNSAQKLSDPVPYCRVDGAITPGEPLSSVPIRFMAALPDDFNGRYFFVSQGGSGGGIVPPPPPKRLSEGFVVASTNRGNAAAHPLDFSWQKEPGQALNNARRGTHLSAVVTQQLTRDYYGTRSLRRYFSGCSGGGTAAVMNMRAYGAGDFDGMIIGAPPVVPAATWFHWARIFQYISVNPGAWIPPSLLSAAEAAIIEQYDGVDGAVDGLIQDDRLIRHFDTNLLRAVGFTEAQVATFNMIRAPWVYFGREKPVPVDGFSISRVSLWSQLLVGFAPPPWLLTTPGAPGFYPVTDQHFRVQVDSNFNFITDLDVDNRAHHALNRGQFDEWADGGPFDFRDFRDDGGKVLIYHGVDDQALSFRESVIAWQGMVKLEAAHRSGRHHSRDHDHHDKDRHGARQLDDWARLFVVPGLAHCSGGPGPDDIEDRLLQASIAWVEKDKAPRSIVSSTSDASRSFLLCPEPSRAVLERPGSDVNDASNWVCRQR